MQTIPVSTAQNLTLVDRAQTLSVHVGPDIAATRAAEVCVTNHQQEPVSEDYEKDSRTLERLAAVRAATAGARDGADPVQKLVEAMLQPPLYNFDLASGLGTLYTAAYRPAEGRVSYVWPGSQTWEQSLATFRPGTKTVTPGVLQTSPS